jgi:hypothetical protein
MSDVKEVKMGTSDEPSLEKNNELGSGEVQDIGAQLFVEGEQITPEELEIEGAEVRKILDKRILPMVSYSYRV